MAPPHVDEGTARLLQGLATSIRNTSSDILRKPRHLRREADLRHAADLADGWARTLEDLVRRSRP